MEKLKSLFSAAEAEQQTTGSQAHAETVEPETGMNQRDLFSEAFDRVIPTTVEMDGGDEPFAGDTAGGAWNLLPVVEHDTHDVDQIKRLGRYQKDFCNILNQKDERVNETSEWTIKPTRYSGDYRAYLVDSSTGQVMDQCDMSPSGMADKCRDFGCDFTNADAFILQKDITDLQAHMSLSDTVYDVANGAMRYVDSNMLKEVEANMNREPYYSNEAQQTMQQESRAKQAEALVPQNDATSPESLKGLNFDY